MQQTYIGRIIHKPARYSLLGEMYQVTTYDEALKDVDVQEWKREIDREMKSIGSNLVWSLIEAPRGIKPIGSKLIYKKKNSGKSYVHKKIQDIVVVFPILYVNNIMLIGNNVKILSNVKGYLKK